MSAWLMLLIGVGRIHPFSSQPTEEGGPPSEDGSCGKGCDAPSPPSVTCADGLVSFKGLRVPRCFDSQVHLLLEFELPPIEPTLLGSFFFCVAGADTMPRVATQVKCCEDGKLPDDAGLCSGMGPMASPADCFVACGACSEGTKPCAAPLLGDVGYTTAAGYDAWSGAALYAGENVYGPFEAGFSVQQQSIFESLGCPTAKAKQVTVAGGIDTATAEQVVAYMCGIELPSNASGTWKGLLDNCGGHTEEYHFHERTFLRPQSRINGVKTSLQSLVPKRDSFLFLSPACLAYCFICCPTCLRLRLCPGLSCLYEEAGGHSTQVWSREAFVTIRRC